MKILVLTIAVFTLNVYVTCATSLDPTQYVDMEDAKSENDDARTKRSGDIFSSLLKKKLGLFSSLAGSSSGKSIGHSEHYEEPLSYNTKSFNLWGVKKAIMGSVLQAAKAITGGVIALKGQLIKAKGHVVVAKGKLMQTKGEAISNFGKTIATHAFDSHQHEPQLDVHSAVGLYNHLPVTPIHQPTSYGVATGLGYQPQAYPGNAFANHGYPINSYPVAAQSYPTGFAVPSTGYEGGSGYGGYGGNGFTSKRAVQQNTQQSSNQVNPIKNLVDKDSVQAGLLIFKPIKMTQNPSGDGGASSFGAPHNVNLQQPSLQLNGNGYNDFKSAAAFQNAFVGAPAAVNGYRTGGGGGYSLYPNAGYPHHTAGYPANGGAYQFPTSGGGGASAGGDSYETFAGQAAYGLQNFAFPQPANSQEFTRQLQQAAYPGQTAYSLETDTNNHNNNNNNNDDHSDNYNGDGYGSAGDQHDSDERVAQPSYKNTRHAEPPKPQRSAAPSADFFLPTTARYAAGSSRANKRSATPVSVSTTPQTSIVPLKYHDDSSAEDQARLKKTVQRFFSMLQKQP